MKCRSCLPPSTSSPTFGNLILLPFFRPGLIGTSSIGSVLTTLPDSSYFTPLTLILFVAPLNRSSSESGSALSTVVTSGVASLLLPPPPIPDGNPPAPLGLERDPPPNERGAPPPKELKMSSNPSPAPLRANSAKMSSAFRNAKPPPPGPPVENWNDVPPPLGIPPKLKPPGMPPAPPKPPAPGPAPPDSGGGGAAPPRRRNSRP